MNLPSSDAPVLIQMMDDNVDGRVSYEEFRAFMSDREKKVRTIFNTLDSNNDSFVDKDELKARLLELNMTAEDKTLEQLIQHLDMNGDGRIDYREFRSFLSLIPSLNVQHLFDQWRDSSSFDMGEDIPVPKYGDKQYPPIILLSAGGIAGAISRTATAPLDRIKVLFQAGNINSSLGAAFKQVYREGGFLSFYRGNGTNVIKIAPETAVKFWAYENLKRTIASDYDNISMAERFTAGALAGTLAQTMVYPLEITKTRLAIAPKGEYRGIAHCLSRILRFEGLRGVYRGFLPAITGIVPYAGTDLAVYSSLKDAYGRRYDSPPSTLTLLTCGAISSTVGQVVAYPLVVVRTRLQAQGMRDRPVMYSGMFDCFRQLVKEGGFRSLYRGILPNFLKAVPAISISYAVYEKSKIVLSEKLGS
eukprot:TRINITY_DN1682_c0_g1_i2.p1 TRINITY_DN1682_c0_g1~~TRINITY_DN1682_c0_g1_i2.p1  ORF type:complete len:482 (+),score=77.18 TRINITY_DN1682_c0_g1_i2:195-1448(+)